MSGAPIFGTDGIRGRAGEGWLERGAVAALGRAAGAVLARAGGGTALVGHDGRRSGPELEAALASGLRDSGLEPHSAGLITTPGLAWLTLSGDFVLGAVLSASHNPAEDNGIKLFSSRGGKLTDSVQEAIESALWAEDRSQEPTGAPPPHDLSFESAYLDHLVSGAGRDLKLDAMSVALDCANGGASRVAPKVFGRLGAKLFTIACEPDGENINRDCGSTLPQALQEEVRARGAKIGIALDGDGDRCVLVDENGALVHGDGIMTVIARHAMEHGEYDDPRIVATVMSNRGLRRALREVGVQVVEVAVGDRAVVEGLQREGLRLGGEQSGHIVLGEQNAFIGDGIVTALAVLRIMCETGRSLSELAAPYRPFPQVLLNVPVSAKPSLTELPSVLGLLTRVEEELGEDGRVLLRYSGTENLARVMVEGPDETTIQLRARELAQAIQSEIGA